jgi:hypothetical protein
MTAFLVGRLAPSVAFGDTSPNASLGEETVRFSPQERSDVGGSAGAAGKGGNHA